MHGSVRMTPWSNFPSLRMQPTDRYYAEARSDVHCRDWGGLSLAAIGTASGRGEKAAKKSIIAMNAQARLA